MLCRFFGAKINVLSNAIKYTIQLEDLQKAIDHRVSTEIVCGIERMTHKNSDWNNVGEGALRNEMAENLQSARRSPVFFF